MPTRNDCVLGADSDDDDCAVPCERYSDQIPFTQTHVKGCRLSLPSSTSRIHPINTPNVSYAADDESIVPRERERSRRGRSDRKDRLMQARKRHCFFLFFEGPETTDLFNILSEAAADSKTISELTNPLSSRRDTHLSRGHQIETSAGKLQSAKLEEGRSRTIMLRTSTTATKSTERTLCIETEFRNVCTCTDTND